MPRNYRLSHYVLPIGSLVLSILAGLVLFLYGLHYLAGLAFAVDPATFGPIAGVPAAAAAAATDPAGVISFTWVRDTIVDVLVATLVGTLLFLFRLLPTIIGKYLGDKAAALAEQAERASAATVEQALQSGAALVIAEAKKKGNDMLTVHSDSALLKIGVDYVRQAVPGKLDDLGITPTALSNKVGAWVARALNVPTPAATYAPTTINAGEAGVTVTTAAPLKTTGGA